MKNLKSIIFLLFIASGILGQSFYLKEFRDSTKAAIFGAVGFMDEDSLNLYMVTNTTYSTGYCSATTGVNYVLKVNKQTGNIVNAKVIGGNPLAMKVTAGFKYNNALYMGGEMSDITTRRCFLLKYDLNLNQVVWALPLITYYSTPMNCVTRMKLNPLTGNIIACGSVNSTFVPSPSCFLLEADTLGNFFNEAGYGFTFDNALMQNPSFDFLKYKSNYHAVSKDFYSDTVYVSNFNNNSIYTSSHKKLNILSDGNNFSVAFNKYILNVVGNNNSFTCFLTDTNFNFIKARKFSNLYFRSAGAGKNNAVLTSINNFNSTSGKEVVNIKIDTNLNIISSKKMSIDTFYINLVTTATIYNETNSTFFNLISKRLNGISSVKLYKSSFPGLFCKEVSYTPTSNTLAISTMSAASFFTGAITPTTALVTDSPKGFTDTLICQSQVGIEELNFSNNHISIYPNPVSSIITVEFQSEFEQPLTVRITDLSGREISKFYLEKPKQSLDVRNLSQGLYLINFYSEKGSFIGSSKFIKSD